MKGYNDYGAEVDDIFSNIKILFKEINVNFNEIVFINSFFREIHTLKGICLQINYSNAVHLIHKLEDLLDEHRKKLRCFNKNTIIAIQEDIKHIEYVFKNFDEI